MNEVKSCPFCGGNDISVIVGKQDAWVECKTCKGKGTYIRVDSNFISEILKEKAISAWNKRPHRRTTGDENIRSESKNE